MPDDLALARDRPAALSQPTIRTHPFGSNPLDYKHKGDMTHIVTNPGTTRHHSMQGFWDDYTDIIDYIVRCTHKMWEEGGIGLLYEHYSQDIKVWSEWGCSFGIERTIEYVLQRTSAFPDLRIYPDDVIWTGDDVAGFRTSHRAVQIGHNTGWSKYGPPTGRRYQFRGIADCVIKANKIVEEWLAHDELTIVRQLGLNVDDVLRTIAEQPPTDTLVTPVVSDPARTFGQGPPAAYTPRRPASADGVPDLEDMTRQSVHEIWNWRYLHRLPTYYSRNYLLHGPSQREGYGLGDLRAYIVALLACFPDGLMEIDDFYFNGNAQDGFRTAVRWTFLGTHRGYGMYGKPTGKSIKIMGATHQIVKDGKFVEEYTVFNELALLWKLRYA